MTQVEELLARLRAPSFWFCESSEGHPGEATTLVHEAADTIEHQSKLLSQAVEALENYADTLCEFGKGNEGCGKFTPDVCGGCLARATVAAIKEHSHAG